SPGILETSEQIATESEYIEVLNDYIAKSKAWESFGLQNTQISPTLFQNLVVLFSNVSAETNMPCQGPEIRTLQYYNSETDMTLGQYLGTLCIESSFGCHAGICDKPSLMHYKIYAHGNAMVKVKISE